MLDRSIKAALANVHVFGKTRQGENLADFTGFAVIHKLVARWALVNKNENKKYENNHDHGQKP